jgi:hypothetical protein
VNGVAWRESVEALKVFGLQRQFLMFSQPFDFSILF